MEVISNAEEETGAQRGQGLAQGHLARQQTEAGFLPLSPVLLPCCYTVGSHPP